MQLILRKSSLILFKTRYPLVVYPVNADVLLFVASLHSKSYFSQLKRGYQCRVATWFCSGSSFYFNVLCVGWLHFFKRYYQYKDIPAFSCNWTTSTFLILNFGFSSFNYCLSFGQDYLHPLRYDSSIISSTDWAKPMSNILSTSSITTCL